MNNLKELLFKNSKINIITTKEISVWNDGDSYEIAFDIFNKNLKPIEFTKCNRSSLIKKYGLIYKKDEHNKWIKESINIPINSIGTLEIDYSVKNPNNINEIEDLILIYNQMIIWTDYKSIEKVIKLNDEYI